MNLDRPLIHWSKRDKFTYRDLLQSVFIVGRTGSGKSSGPNLLLARAMFSNHIGGIIFCSKPEDKDWWLARAKEARRLDDVILFDASGNRRFNFTQYLNEKGLDSLELTRVIVQAAEMTQDGTEKEVFWRSAMQIHIWNAVEAVRMGGDVSVGKIKEFIDTAAFSFEIKEQDAWKQGYHKRVLDAAQARTKTPREANDYNLLMRYWAQTFPMMDNRLQTSINATASNVLHFLNTGLCWELLSTRSDFSLDDMFAGKFILVDATQDQLGESGRVISSVLKFMAQRAILRRKANPGDPIAVIHCDECQDLLSSYDATFLAKCRSHRGCQIFITQSIHALGGEKPKYLSLLTNFGLVVACTLGDAETARIISDKCGQDYEYTASYKLGHTIFRPGEGSISETLQSRLKTLLMLSGLREHGGVVDAVLVRNGLPWSNGLNHMLISFRQ